MSNIEQTVRLSSRFTRFNRTVLPGAWFALCAAFAVGALLDGELVGLAGVIAAAVGYLWFRLTVWNMVELWATPESLLVRFKGKEYRVLYDNVEEAEMHWYFHFAEIKLVTPYELGPVICYLPYRFIGIPFVSRYPGNDLVLEMARNAREKHPPKEA